MASNSIYEILEPEIVEPLDSEKMDRILETLLDIRDLLEQLLVGQMISR